MQRSRFQFTGAAALASVGLAAALLLPTLHAASAPDLNDEKPVFESPARTVLQFKSDPVKFIGVPDAKQAFEKANARFVEIPWRRAIGMRVRVEGLTWGRREPFDGRLVLDGTDLYYRGEAAKKLEADGKLLRIVGVLQATEPDAKGERAYFVEVDRAELIERVSSLRVWDEKHRLGK